MNVGETVTITVRNPLWDKRGSYAFPMGSSQTYTGTIVPSPIWVSEDQICLSTGSVQFPFRVIDRDRIIGLSEAREKPESKVFTIEGSKGKSYLVTLEKGRWGCDCVGFGFRRECSHVVSAKSLISQGNKKVEKTEEKCCFNSKSAVQSKSKVKRGRRPLLNMETVNMAKVTKTQVTIRVMTENEGKPMSEVVKLIAAANGVSEAVAKGAYRWCVKKGVAPGLVEATKRTAVKTKTKKVPAEKLLKDLNISTTKQASKVKAEVTKTAEEIAKIKKDNLARMRQVSAKLAAARSFNEETLPEYVEKDPFSAPASLTMDEVKALV